MSDTINSQPEGFDAALEENELVKRARSAVERASGTYIENNLAELDVDVILVEAIEAGDTAVKNYIEQHVLGIAVGGSVSTQRGNVGRLARLPLAGGLDPLRQLDSQIADDPYVLSPAKGKKPAKLARGQRFWKRTIRNRQSAKVKHNAAQGIKSSPAQVLDDLLATGGNLQSVTLQMLEEIETLKIPTTLENLVPSIGMLQKATKQVAASGDDGTLDAAVAKANALAQAIIDFNAEASKV